MFSWCTQKQALSVSCAQKATEGAYSAFSLTPCSEGLVMVVLAAIKLFIALMCAIAYSAAADQSEAGPLVQVNFYGEALCPYCARFLDTVAAKIYDNGVMNMTRFRYIPYGNAKETQDGVVCQHGPQECDLNRILSCAIHLNPDQQVWFPFAKCLESPGPSKIHPLEPAESCAQDASIKYSAIQECASGQMAVELQTKAAEETASLKPAHTYVPWVTVNGIAIGGAFEQLQTFICASYLGERPEVCYGPPQIALSSATHATLSQVLQQIDHRLNR